MPNAALKEELIVMMAGKKECRMEGRRGGEPLSTKKAETTQET